MKERYFKSAIGCLVGTAVGDALGLPYKRLSRRKIFQHYTPIKGHTLILSKGMFSTNTEHTCMTAQSLIVSAGDRVEFTRDLTRRLRMWLLGFPVGIDLATLKSSLKLWFGVSPQESGVNSADSGAAMGSAIIGVFYGEYPERLVALVQASTVMTHNSLAAELGAIAVAVAAYLASIRASIQPQEYYQTLQKFFTHSSANLTESAAVEFLDLIEQACRSAEQNESGVAFADRLSNHNSVSSDIGRSVPIIIQIWLRNQNRYSKGLKEIIYLGGDTATTAAILGGIIGTSVGTSGIQQKWLDDIIDFPRNINWIETLGKRLAQSCQTKSPHSALPLAFYLLPLRNLIFLIAILFRAFYRLLLF